MLEFSRKFFEYLHSQNIKYCHWKSNSHLYEALTGQTDLDILVHEEDKKQFNQALQKFKFLEILSPPDKQFRYLEDYLGFDQETGKLIHLHVHYKLILGQRFIKNHHLPVEDLFWSNLITKDNIFIPKPELELLFLIIRASMKVEGIALLKHAIKDFTAPGYTAFPAGIEKEFKELISSSDINTLLDLLQQSQLPVDPKICINFIEQFNNQSLKFYDLIILNRKILKSLSEYQRNKGPAVFIRYHWLVIRNLRIVTKFFPSKKKCIAHRGFSFSVIGADGSGKTTLTADLNKWFSWKLFVRHYYYGIPKTFFVKTLNLASRGFKKIKLPFLQSAIDSFTWVYIARKRYLISQLIKDKVAKGNLVITDRFPLKHFYSMEQAMDGPRLSCSKTPPNLFSKIEADYYKKITRPDYLFVLQVSLDELRKRKTDLDISTHKIKADAVNSIADSENIITIDANIPYAEVCLTVKRKVWELLTKMANTQK